MIVSFCSVRHSLGLFLGERLRIPPLLLVSPPPHPPGGIPEKERPRPPENRFPPDETFSDAFSPRGGKVLCDFSCQFGITAIGRCAGS